MTLRVMGDWELLEAYTKHRSEKAFAELVKAHFDWVYSVAIRQVGDADLAEDVVQSVFVLLARKGGELRPGTILGGWLFRTTCNVAAHARRAELRRKIREAKACTMSDPIQPANESEILWDKLAPHLDVAVSALSESDRAAILLRFYERASMRQVAERLGITEEAAKKRVSRAVGRMREFLAKRGVKTGSLVLAGVLMEKTVQAASEGMAAAAANVALASASASTSVTLPSLARETLRGWQRAKAMLSAAVGIASVAAMIAIAYATLSLFHSSSVPTLASGETHKGNIADAGWGKTLGARRKTGAGGAMAGLPEQDDLTFTGRVVDKFSGEPVEGATVRVRRQIYSATEQRLLEETVHQTDVNGRFTFSLTPDQSKVSALYLNFEVEHPDYARRPWDGYAMSMIRRNASLGAPPFFEHLDIAPAERISGVLLQPDGAAAVGVKVLAYSKAVKTNMADYGSFAETNTDASGRFRLNVVKGGEAVLWLLPRDFAPSTHLIHRQRGDLGEFALEEGVRLTGRVMNSEGLPTPRVWVNAELSGGPAKKFIDMPVVDALGRSALSDNTGHFEMGPLPAGDYDVLISETPRNEVDGDPTRYPVPDVFAHQKVNLEAGKATEEVEIRAVPHVTLAIQQEDSQGHPRKSHEVMVSGNLNGTAWWGESRPDENGRVVLKVPKGLAMARINLLVNEHQSTRYRWSSGSDWQNGNEMTLPILEYDSNEISVIYYKAPIVVVQALAPDGSQISDFKCQVNYPQGRKPAAQAPHWINGSTGDINFDKQPDGRWRSEGLLPDEDFSLTVDAEGFQPWTETLSLAEGAEETIVAKLSF